MFISCTPDLYAILDIYAHVLRMYTLLSWIRGGDILKWFDCYIDSVVGLDISEKEIDEARTRLAAFKREGWTQCSAKPRHVNYQFHECAVLGVEEIAWPSKFEAVSCMYAVHYFFSSRDVFKTYLLNVYNALSDRGVFFGTVPSGKVHYVY